MKPKLLMAILTLAPAVHAAVLVELFTSEGCSSCPPADALLEKLDRPDVIVLSEHVDYWNHLGWKDPYSSPRFSGRQRAYASRLRLDGVYTPQMVVDGAIEFVGSDARRAQAAIAQAAQGVKANVRVTQPGGATVRVEVDPAEAPADVYLALASTTAASQVLHGENGGRMLRHVAVVRSLTWIGAAQARQPFAKEIPVKAGNGEMRVVAFVQERGQGRVLGAAMRPLSKD